MSCGERFVSLETSRLRTRTWRSEENKRFGSEQESKSKYKDIMYDMLLVTVNDDLNQFVNSVYMRRSIKF